MGRYDKVQPKGGSYRATLAAAWNAANIEVVLAVGHDVNGLCVIGAGQTGVKGLLVLTKAYPVGWRIDVMRIGEIVEFGPSDAGKVPGTDFGVPGTNYYGHPDGTVTATKGADGVYVGHTADDGKRLIVGVGAGV